MTLSISPTATSYASSPISYSPIGSIHRQSVPNTAAEIARKTDYVMNSKTVFLGENVPYLKEVLRRVQKGTITPEEIPLVKSEGYLSRLRSNESWFEWSENKTPLGRVLSKYCEYVTTDLSLKTFMQSLDPEVIKVANRDAAALVLPFSGTISLADVDETNGVVFEGAKKQMTGATLDVAYNLTGHSLPALLVSSSSKGFAVFFGQNSSHTIALNDPTQKNIRIVDGGSGIIGWSNPLAGSKETGSKSVLIMGAPTESCAYFISDLDDLQNVKVCDASKNEALGKAVCFCDMNDDGIEDVVVGAPSIGKVYVFFRNENNTLMIPPPFTPTALNGANGFVLYGSAPNDRFGANVGCVRDFHAKGTSSLIIAAPSLGNKEIGAVYVVRGQKEPFTSSVNITDLHERLTIHGSLEYYGVGQTAVTQMIDMNGDGLNEVGIAMATCNRAFIVFGIGDNQTASVVTDLVVTDLDGKNGVILVGPDGPMAFGSSLASGKIDSDLGLVVVGSPFSSPNGVDAAGQAFVIYFDTREGHWDREVFVENLGVNGCTINGVGLRSFSGDSLGVGDFNQDGKPDIFIGAPFASSIEKAKEGKTYVLLGGRMKSVTPSQESTSQENRTPIAKIATDIIYYLGLTAASAFGIKALFKNVIIPILQINDPERPLDLEV